MNSLTSLILICVIATCVIIIKYSSQKLLSTRTPKTDYYQTKLIVTGNKYLDNLFMWQYYWDRDMAKVKLFEEDETVLGVVEKVYDDTDQIIIRTPFTSYVTKTDDELNVGDVVSGVILKPDHSHISKQL